MIPVIVMRVTSAVVIAAAIASCFPTVAAADGDTPPLARFKKGRVQFKNAGKSYVMPLISGAYGRSGKERFWISLAYVFEAESAEWGIPAKYEFQLTLSEVASSGRYGSKNVTVARLHIGEGATQKELTRVSSDEKKLQALVEAALRERRSVFESGRSDCSGELRRVSTTGIEGTMACPKMTDGGGGAGLPILDIRFMAVP